MTTFPAFFFLVVALVAIFVGIFVGRTNETSTSGSSLLSPYTVGSGGNFTTIQSAVDAAAATGQPQTIYVKGGTYTEDVKISTSGISIVGLAGTISNVLLKGNLSLTSPNVAPFVYDIALENMNITGNILSTTPNAFYKLGIHVGNIEVSGGGATSRLVLDSVSSSGGLITVMGDAGTFLPLRCGLSSPITVTGKASLNGQDTTFIGDLTLSQSIGGLNNIRGGAVTGVVVVNGPASFALVDVNATSPTWKSMGVGGNLILIGCTGLAATQNFTSSGGGQISFAKHSGGNATLIMGDSLGAFTVNQTSFGNLTFDVTDGTTGVFNILESTFNHFDDPTFLLPTMNGGKFTVSNCFISSDRMRFGGTVNYTAENTTFTLSDPNPFNSLMRFDSAGAVISFQTCIFNAKTTLGAVVWNFGVAGTSITAVNCSVRQNPGVTLANGGFGVINRNESSPGVGALEMQGGAAGGPLGAGTVFGVADVFTV